MDIIEKLKNKKIFSATELLIANYILSNLEQVIYLSIRELATQTYTSNSAVMRTIKKVYSGSFDDFKVRLALEKQSLLADLNHNLYLKKEDNVGLIIDKVTSIQIGTIQETRAIIDYNQIIRVINFINKATKIYIYAESINLQTAKEVKYMLARVGKSVDVVLEEGFTTLNDLSDHQNRIAIFISHRRGNITLTKKMMVNYKYHVPIIYISGYSNPEIDKYCLEVIRVKHGKPYSEMGPIVYTTSIKYILNIIVSAIIVSDFDNCHKNLEEYKTMLKS